MAKPVQSFDLDRQISCSTWIAAACVRNGHHSALKVRLFAKAFSEVVISRDALVEAICNFPKKNSRSRRSVSSHLENAVKFGAIKDNRNGTYSRVSEPVFTELLWERLPYEDKIALANLTKRAIKGSARDFLGEGDHAAMTALAVGTTALTYSLIEMCPSQEVLADVLGMSPSTLQRALRQKSCPAIPVSRTITLQDVFPPQYHNIIVNSCKGGYKSVRSFKTVRETRCIARRDGAIEIKLTNDHSHKLKPVKMKDGKTKKEAILFFSNEQKEKAAQEAYETDKSDDANAQAGSNPKDVNLLPSDFASILMFLQNCISGFYADYSEATVEDFVELFNFHSESMMSALKMARKTPEATEDIYNLLNDAMVKGGVKFTKGDASRAAGRITRMSMEQKKAHHRENDASFNLIKKFPKQTRFVCPKTKTAKQQIEVKQILQRDGKMFYIVTEESVAAQVLASNPQQLNAKYDDLRVKDRLPKITTPQFTPMKLDPVSGLPFKRIAGPERTPFRAAVGHSSPWFRSVANYVVAKGELTLTDANSIAAYPLSGVRIERNRKATLAVQAAFRKRSNTGFYDGNNFL